MDKKEHLKGHSAIQERDYRQGNPVVLLSALLSVVAVVAMVALPSQAASARNTYAEVNSSTPGVTHIYSIEDDFYVTTRQVSAPSFRADIDITACHPYQMTSPRNGHVCLGIGGSSPYMVRDESGGEDTGHGIVQVLKLDIEQSTVRIGWNANSCSLNLTSDSVPGGQAVWSSSPAGIAGCGRSISFNPSSLEPGEYVVTAKSSLIDDYYDTCVVKIVRITLDGFNPTHTWARGRYCSVECHQTQCRAEVEPEGETGITYSIVDDPCGAVIDSNTGVVTPGVNISGLVTIRATATSVAECYDEDVLIIKAIPTGWESCELAASTRLFYYYGGNWTHTFTTSGGSLDGIRLSEKLSLEKENLLAQL